MVCQDSRKHLENAPSAVGTVEPVMFFGIKETDIMVSQQGHHLQPHLVAAQPSPQAYS